MKYIYWITTCLFCALMLWSATMYLTQYEMVVGFFEALNFPVWIIYPLAILKILGVVMVLWRCNRWLTEWAYAGIFFDMLLAMGAHMDANDGGYIMPIAGAILLLISYFTGNKIRKWKV